MKIPIQIGDRVRVIGPVGMDPNGKTYGFMRGAIFTVTKDLGMEFSLTLHNQVSEFYADKEQCRKMKRRRRRVWVASQGLNKLRHPVTHAEATIGTQELYQSDIEFIEVKKKC